jgi:sulfur dioxygenase
MLIRQLFDQNSSSYSYLLADRSSREALLIDPVFEQFDRDRTLIEELQLRLSHVLETHVHSDHVTSGGMLRAHFGAKLVMSELAGVPGVDLPVKHGDSIRCGRHTLEVRATPGHTAACVSYACAAEHWVCTGDALLIRACGRSDLQQGDAVSLYRSLHEQLFSLPDDTTVYPAHDYKGRTSSSIGEERRLNPRIGHAKPLAEFVRIMQELKLPQPRALEAVLAANMRCGLPEPEASAHEPAPSNAWAPIQLSSTGVPELNADALQNATPADARLIDVREPDEFRGELGHIAGATLVPLGALLTAAGAWPKAQPLVLVCRSGVRSGKGALQLLAAGFDQVASLQGGMLGWNAQHLPTVRGSIASRQG